MLQQPSSRVQGLSKISSKILRKNLLMMEEQKKELEKQLKAVIEERRDTLVQVLQVDQDFIENAVIVDEKTLAGICCGFIRVSDKALVENNIINETNFFIMDCTEGIMETFVDRVNVLLGMLEHLSVLYPGSKSNVKSEEILERMQLPQYCNLLLEAVKNLKQRLILCLKGPKALLNDVKSPADYSTAAGNRDLVFQLESFLEKWLIMIETVLAESEQLRREENDIGPNAELIYWKGRMFKFINVLEQLKNPEVKKVVGILQVAKSKLIKKWIELSGRITDVANEAKDNVKYLLILDKFLEPINKSTNPNSISDQISSLMNVIQMIYCNSQYFNTSERMTSLFVKITNQLISTCKAYILDDEYKIWERNM
ncbi:hypothetical protein Ahia01_001374800 [Argonauta hians]